MSIKKFMLSTVRRLVILSRTPISLHLNNLIFAGKLEMVVASVSAIVNTRPENANRILFVI